MTQETREGFSHLASDINSQIGAMAQETREGFSHLASDMNNQIGAMAQGAWDGFSQVNDRLDQFSAGTKADFEEMTGEFSSRMSQMTGYVTEKFGQMTMQMTRMSEENRNELAALTADSRRAMEQMTAMTQDSRKAMEQITAEAGRQIHEEVRQMSQQSEEVRQTIDEISGHVTGLKEELSQKIHTEDVKCFRNIKDLIDEQKPLFEEVGVSEKSMKPVKKYIYWLILFGVLDLVGIVVLGLIELGVF